MSLSETAPACVTCGASPASPRSGHDDLTCDCCDARERRYAAALNDLTAEMTPIITRWAQRHHEGGLGIRELTAVLDEYGVSYGHGPFTDTQGVVQAAVDAPREPTGERDDTPPSISSQVELSAVQIAAAKVALSVAEVALLTPLSEDEVYAALNAEKLRARRGARNKWVITRTELDRFLVEG